MLCSREYEKNILSMIYNLYLNIENLSDTDTFISLMTTEDPDMLHLLQQLLSSLFRRDNKRVKTLIYGLMCGVLAW